MGVDEREDPVVLVEDVEVLAAGGGQDVALAPLPVVDAHLVEDGDRTGGHQHRIGPRGVLVVAGWEGEPLGLDELAAVRLVPDDHEDFQQTGPVGEGESGGTRLGEIPGEGVAHALARPVRTGVVVDQDVRLPGPRDPVGDGPQGAGGEGVVTVQEDQVVAGGLCDPGVTGEAEAHVLRQVQGPHPAVAGGEPVDDGAAGIGGAVIHRDDLEVRIGLAQHRVQALVQIRLNPVRGHDDTEPGHNTSMGRSLVRAGGPQTADGVRWLRRNVAFARSARWGVPVRSNGTRPMLTYIRSTYS